MIFWSVVSKLLPLYIITLQGFIAGKLHKMNGRSISQLMADFMLPVIFFDVACNLKMEFKYAIFPILCFLFMALFKEANLRIARRFFNDGNEKIIALGAGSINTTSIGLSIAMLLFNDEYIRIFMLSTIGVTLYNNTIGMHLLSDKVIPRKDKLTAVLKMPLIYAFLIGLIFNALDIRLFNGFDNLFAQMRSAYLVLGMMILGLSLSSVRVVDTGKLFIIFFLLSKTIISPLIMMIIIIADKFLFHIYDLEMYKIFLMLSTLPPGVNALNFSVLYRFKPGKFAVGMLISTIIATIYIPFIMQLIK